MSIEIMQQALDALINSRDTVWNVYQTDWRHGLPTRLSQMFAMEKECKDHDAAIAALEAELVKPEQEPVAWQNLELPMEFYEYEHLDPMWHHHYRPLYTSTPRKEWVGLTDEEIKNILDCGRGGLVDIKKAEAKLRIKNG